MKSTIIVLLLSFTCLASAAPDRPINVELAKRALVVMRAKKLSELPGTEKYRWYEVEVIEVFENRAEQMFLDDPIKVAVLKPSKGIPDGVSTLYLERYGKSDKVLWILVGGGAATGISHTSK